MDIQFNKSTINVSVKARYTEFQPYMSMIDDGESTEQEMQAAADHICWAIETEAASGREFKDSYNRISAIQNQYSDLGFADSEGTWLINEMCRRVWGKPACDWLGEY